MLRQTTKFNGVSYRYSAAEAALSPEGMAQCREHLDVYRTNAKIMTETLKELGIYGTSAAKFTVHLDAVPERHEILGVFDDLLPRQMWSAHRAADLVRMEKDSSV